MFAVCSCICLILCFVNLNSKNIVIYLCYHFQNFYDYLSVLNCKNVFSLLVPIIFIFPNPEYCKVAFIIMIEQQGKFFYKGISRSMCKQNGGGHDK
jgi:hypothetical protein